MKNIHRVKESDLRGSRSEPEDAQSYHKDMCSAMFIAALFVIARNWEQLKCPLDQRMDKGNVVTFTKWSTIRRKK